MEFPKALRREPPKLLLYLNKELASAGYIAGERVIFLGRKEPSSFGALIDRYVKDYVICPVCGSPDTRTEKNKKLGFLLCEACGARSSIKANYAWQKICYAYLLIPLSFFALRIMSTMCFTWKSPTNEESFYTMSRSSLAARSLLRIVFTKSNKQMSWFITRKYQSQIQPINLSGASVGIIWPSSHAFPIILRWVSVLFSSLSIKISK